MRRVVYHVLGLAVLLLCAGATRADADEPGGLPEGWKTTAPMPDKLWGPEGRYLVWVEGGWLQVRRETSDGQTDWHIVLARATDPRPPVVKEPGMPPKGNPRFEVAYREGRFFIREDLNVLRAVREPKPAAPAAWPAIVMPGAERSRMGWGRSAGPPLQMVQGFVEPWFLCASGPGDDRFDCWLRLTPSALIKNANEGNGVQVFASGLIQAFGGKNRVFDDGSMLLAVRSSESEARVVANIAIGAQAPRFAVKTLDGKPLALDDHRGKYVLLDFWATWCGPCVAEMPALQAVHAAFGADDRFVLISLSLDREIEAARTFVKERGLSWVQAFVGDESGEQVLEDYGTDAIPATFLIGPDGKVIARGMRGDAIMKAVKKALGKP